MVSASSVYRSLIHLSCINKCNDHKFNLHRVLNRQIIQNVFFLPTWIPSFSGLKCFLLLKHYTIGFKLMTLVARRINVHLSNDCKKCLCSFILLNYFLLLVKSTRVLPREENIANCESKQQKAHLLVSSLRIIKPVVANNNPMSKW